MAIFISGSLESVPHGRSFGEPGIMTKPLSISFIFIFFIFHVVTVYSPRVDVFALLEMVNPDREAPAQYLAHLTDLAWKQCSAISAHSFLRDSIPSETRLPKMVR